MENINTAYNLAQLITGLPVVLGVLPVFYEDCDCGNGLHAVNSLYPDVDTHRNIYLRPSATHHQATDILAEYNRLNQENEIIRKQVEKACADGVETHTYSEPPAGWDKCELKTRTGRVVAHFDPHKENNANGIIAYFSNAVKDAIGIQSDGNVTRRVNYFIVGYPGNRQHLRFNLNDLRVDMTVTDMEVTPEEFPHDSYMHLKLHFKVTMDWEPDLDYFLWKEMDVRYKHRDIYEFDDALSLIRLPLGTEGETVG
jgi:hypothetical protein